MPRLKTRANVSFIFEAGAEITLSMPVDGLLMGVEYAEFGNTGATFGVGGLSETFVEPAYAAFAGKGVLYGHPIGLKICEPTEAWERFFYCRVGT